MPKRISTATRHRMLHPVEAHQPEIAVLTATVAQEAAVVAVVVAAADGVAEADITDAATVDMAVRGTKSGCVGISCCLGRGALASGSRHFLLPADDRQVSRLNSHSLGGCHRGCHPERPSGREGSMQLIGNAWIFPFP